MSEHKRGREFASQDDLRRYMLHRSADPNSKLTVSRVQGSDLVFTLDASEDAESHVNRRRPDARFKPKRRKRRRS